MRVYAETNFILEMAREQEQLPACEELIQLAEAKSVELVIPAFSFFEALDTQGRKQLGRQALQKTLEVELREFARTRQFADEAAFATIQRLLVRSAQDETTRLEDIRERLFRVASVLPLDAGVVADGVAYRREYKLSLPDALVLASVMRDPRIGAAPSCFLNRNAKDFISGSGVPELLNKRGCKLFGRFDAGLSHIRHALEGVQG